MSSILVQVIVGGLLLGAVYALFSSGLTLIWGMMNIINFAHGDFVMLGMYVAFVVYTLLGAGPLIGVPAFIMDGVYVGATWTRDMRNLMAAALAVYLAAWWAMHSLGNTGLWLAFLTFYVFRGGLQVLRYPSLARKPWPER